MNLVCISHPRYRGVETPLLSCKTCCSIHVASIKEWQKSKSESEAPRREQFEHNLIKKKPMR